MLQHTQEKVLQIKGKCYCKIKTVMSYTSKSSWKEKTERHKLLSARGRSAKNGCDWDSNI